MGAVATVGRGMLAGAVGTAAMTLGQAVEMSASGRAPSPVPGQVGARLLRRGDPERLNTAVHWVHGVVNGGLRGLLGAAGQRGPRATAIHFAAVWGTDAALYVALGIAPPPWRWKPAELATDLAHKGTYAAVTGAVFDRLARR